MLTMGMRSRWVLLTALAGTGGLAIDALAQSHEPDLSPEQAQYIIIETGTEALHYAKGCFFVELRSALSGTIKTAKWTSPPPNLKPEFEIRMIGNGVQRIFGIGENWILEEDGAFAYLTPNHFRTIADIVSARAGEGGRKDKVDELASQVMATQRDPAYQIPGHNCHGIAAQNHFAQRRKLSQDPNR